MRYDYIVVGGGSAGCVATHRLVAEHKAKVLLLEAGGSHRRALVNIPSGSFKMLFGKGDYFKRYVSLPQSSLAGRALEIAQGNLLGGGSSVNAMTYMRGTKADYEAWDQSVGNVGWGWQDMLPYFVRQEGNSRLRGPSHGSAGPLKVQDHRYVCALAYKFIETMRALGIPQTEDFNSGDERGVGLTQISCNAGKRSSAATAFLDPVLDDDHLMTLTRAVVTEVLFEGSQAIGVKFIRNGVSEAAYCENEVILTGGAYNSPKVLMLSGIGPADHLLSHGIRVKVDLPGVGQQMQDHHMVPVFALTLPGYGYHGQDKGLRLALNGLRYLLQRRGPIASNGSESLAYVNLKAPAEEPTLQIYCIGTMFLPPELGKPDHGMMLCPTLIRPQSRGWMRLRSANPLDDPEFSPNYFAEPEDLKAMVDAVRYSREILGSEPLASVVRHEIVPGEGVNTDEELARFCQASTFTNYHPVGSCRMGTPDDNQAVVDPCLRVRGVSNLRILDASIIPRIPSANTNAPVMAIADRGIDLMTGRASLRAPR